LSEALQEGSENPASRKTLIAVCLDAIQIGTSDCGSGYTKRHSRLARAGETHIRH